MKTHIASLTTLLAALAGLAAVSATASPGPDACILYRVKCVESHGRTNPIKVHATAMDVKQMLGLPHHQPGRDVWIYHNFHADREETNRQGCNNLVITFDRVSRRVTDLKLVNDRAVAVIIAQAEAAPAAVPRVLVAAK